MKIDETANSRELDEIRPDLKKKIKIWFLWPFQDYFTYIEPIVYLRWVNTGVPREKPPDLPMQNLARPYLLLTHYILNKLFPISCTSICHFRGVDLLVAFILFLMENPVSKQCRL